MLTHGPSAILLAAIAAAALSTACAQLEDHCKKERLAMGDKAPETLTLDYAHEVYWRNYERLEALPGVRISVPSYVRSKGDLTIDLYVPDLSALDDEHPLPDCVEGVPIVIVEKEDPVIDDEYEHWINRSKETN